MRILPTTYVEYEIKRQSKGQRRSTEANSFKPDEYADEENWKGYVPTLFAFLDPFNFSTYPTLTHTKSGVAGDPINVVFIGSKDQILHSFHQAGWLIPDPITTRSSKRIAMGCMALSLSFGSPINNLHILILIQNKDISDRDEKV